MIPVPHRPNKGLLLTVRRASQARHGAPQQKPRSFGSVKSDDQTETGGENPAAGSAHKSGDQREVKELESDL